MINIEKIVKRMAVYLRCNTHECNCRRLPKNRLRRLILEFDVQSRLWIFKIKRSELIFGNDPAILRHLVQGAMDHLYVHRQIAVDLAQFH
jgi:hypothetical protein